MSHQNRNAADQIVANSNLIDHTQSDAHTPIRVAYLIDNLGVAGTEQWLLRLITNLDRSRILPFLCLLDGRSSASLALPPDGIPVLRLGVKKLGSLAAITAARRFVRFLKTEKIDVVQLHFPDSTYFGAPLAWYAGVRRIIGTNRNAGYWATPIQRILSRFAARFFTDIIANSTASLVASKEIFRSERARVAVIHNGVDLWRFRNLPPLRIEKAADDKWRVGIVANLRPVKDLPTFIHAAGEVLQKVPDVEFLIAGEGPDRDALRELITAKGLNDHVRLLGSIIDIPGFLGRLDVAVLCSKSEGWSNSLIEYMAARRPVVATAVGGNAELITSDSEGLLCCPGDSHGMASAISSLLLNRRFAKLLAFSGYAKCENSFSSQLEFEKYASFVLTSFTSKRM